jgi:hypothetical protein
MVYWFKVQEKIGRYVLTEIEDTTLSNAFARVRRFYPVSKIFAIDEDDAKGLLRSMHHETIT